MIRARHLLFGLPVGIGGLAAAGLTAFVIWPQFQQIQVAQSRAAELRELEAQLPLMARQLEREQKGVTRAQEQQAVVLQLIAGSGSLATFLAQVDRIAASSGVTLALFEPLSAAPLPQDEKTKKQADATAAEKDKGAPPPASDPLQAPGLTKEELLLSARGRYPALLAFMRGLERLNVLVVQSNLQLSLLEPKDKANAPAVLPVVLKMSVATYAKKTS